MDDSKIESKIDNKVDRKIDNKIDIKTVNIKIVRMKSCLIDRQINRRFNRQ